MSPIRLGDVLEVKHGYAFPGLGFGDRPDAPQVLTPGNFALGGGFRYAKSKSFDGDYPGEFLLRGGEVVVTMTDLSKAGDTLGFAAILPDGHFLHNQRIGLVRVTDSELLDERYFSYLTRTAAYRSHILGTASGSTVRHTSPSRIGDYETELPLLEEQRAIAAVLGALDDKIAANTRLVETADGLSQVVFRSIAGSASLAPLSTTARFVNGKAFTKGASGTGRVVIRIAELNSGLGGSTVFSDAEVGDDFLARPGDILFAWSGSLTLHRWFRPEAIVNQHIFKVIPNGYPSWLIYELLRDRLAYFKGIAADKATTMGHIQRGHLDVLVDVPSSSSIDRVDELMTSLWDRTLLAERENETLAVTRDALLPHLMSGKLRVTDAKEVLEGVL